jgi:hypothetical protein
MLLGTNVGIEEEKQALFIIQLMSREDALQIDEQGSYYIDELTDYLSELDAFMRRTNGRGRVFFSFAFVGDAPLEKITAEIRERGAHGILTMSDVRDLLERFG